MQITRSLQVPSFTIEGFLLSALDDFPAINKHTKEKKEDTVNRYAALLRKEKLAGEKTLHVLDERILRRLGIPLGHALFISEAAKNFGKKVEGKSVETVIQKALKGVGTIDANNTLPNIPLQERDEQLKKAFGIIGDNLRKMSSPQEPQGAITGKELIVPAVSGGAGIGKTTLGYECARQLFKSWKHLVPLQFQNAKTLYLMLDFSRGYSLGCTDTKLNPAQILAIRLAHAYFVVEKMINLDFPTFFALCFERIALFNIEDVFLAIRADLNLTMDVPLFVFLHIDEVQTIFSFEGRYKSASGKGIFKDLIYEAFKSSDLFTIQPFLSGTAHSKVMASKEPTMYTFEFIDAPLLSLGGVLNIIEHYASQFGAHPWEWKMQLPFLKLLGDMGGLPRAISYLLEECFGRDHSRGPEFFQKISSLSFYPIFKRVAKIVEARYGLEGFLDVHKVAALEVLGHSIRGVSVTRDTVLGNTSVEEMDHKGQIFLQQVGTNCYLRLPFLFIFIYNRYLEFIPDELAGVAFNQDNKMTWQNWESFNALFQVFLNNFFIYDKAKISLTLGDFYHKADGHDSTKSLLVELNPLELVPVVHQFPAKTLPVLHKDTGKLIDWTKCRHLLLNDNSANFGDTVTIRAVDKHSAEKYFGRPVDNIVICCQHKWDYNGDDFTVEEAVEGHQGVLKTANESEILDSCGLITVIFTTRPLPKDKIQSIPKDILIVHGENFKEFYGPFATRAEFSIARAFNPNLADVQQLQPALGGVEGGTEEISRERQKRPFKNLDDLCDRVKRAKKTSQLTFFPFPKHLYLPFEGNTTQKEESDALEIDFVDLV